MVKIAKKKLLGVMLFVSFLLGAVAGAIYASFPDFGLEKPLSIFASQKSSPSDRIKDLNVRVFDDRVIIYINEPYLAKFADTHSMEPVLDRKSTGIEIVPKSSNEIKVGDIISYESDGDTIIHRVVKAGKDSEGWYAITKGDNNANADTEKVRFSQVKRILVGILY